MKHRLRNTGLKADTSYHAIFTFDDHFIDPMGWRSGGWGSMRGSKGGLFPFLSHSKCVVRWVGVCVTLEKMRVFVCICGCVCACVREKQCVCFRTKERKGDCV